MEIRASVMRLVSLPALLVAAAVARAGDVSVNLTEPDEFANRAVVVTRTDKTQLAGVLSVSTYEATARTFVFETAREGSVRLAAKDVRELAFVRSLKESSPQAQTCPWVAIAHPGPTATAKVAGGALRIERGKLVVDTADFPPPVAPGATLEAQQITYDRRMDVFTVTLQQVGYELSTGACGGGGDPGARKPIQ